MALKVGDLYVSLTANTQKLQSQLNSAAKKVEAFGRNLKSLGKDASEMSNMVTAAVGAAVAVASSKDAAVKKQVEELKNQSTALAIEVARVALPVLQSMADFVGRVVALFRALTPEQRAMLLTFIEMAAAVSAVGMAAVRLEPAFKLVATSVRFVGAAMGGLSVGLLPAIAAVAVLVGFAGLLRESWDENLLGIQETAAKVWGWMQSNGPKLGKVLGGVAEYVGRVFQQVFLWIAQIWAAQSRAVVQTTVALGRALGIDKLVDLDGWEELGSTFADWIEQLPTDSGLEAVADDALEQFGRMKVGVTKIGGDIVKTVKGVFGSLPDAAKATAFKDLTDAGAKAQTDFGRLRADKMEASFVALRGRGGNLRDSLEMAGALNVPKELEQFTGDALSSIKGIEDVRDFLHKLGAKSGETEKYLAAWEKWNEEQRKNAQHVDRLRADMTTQAAARLFGGGTLGESARMAGITSGIPPEFEQFSGSLLRTASDFEDLRDRLAQVREKNPLIDQFIDQMQAVQEDAAKKAKELEEARKQAIDGFRDGVVGSLGKLGGVIQAATGPLAQAAGPIGALVAVGVELLKNSTQFGEFQAALDGVIQGLSDALGQLLPPFTMLVRAIQPIVSALGAIVSTVVPLLTSVIEPLLPVFVVLGALLMTLSPIIGAIVQVLQVALIPIMGVLNGVMKALFGAIQVVAYVILGYVVLYGELWNGIISAVQAVLTFLASIEIAGGKPFAFLGEWAASLESSKAATDTYRQQMNDVGNMTWDAAMTTAQSFGNAAGAADTLAAGMTNAASGFKADLARFNATNVGSSIGSPADLGVSSGALVGDTYVTIVSNDPEAIWNRMESLRRRGNFQRGRGTLGGLPAFGG